MKKSNHFVFAALLTTVLLGEIVAPIRASDDAVASSQTTSEASALTFDEGKPVPAARDAALPASVKRTLPRGAKTIFCVAARLDNRAVLLHGWNNSKGATTLDILATTAAPSKSRNRKRRAVSPPRLKRITAGRVAPMRNVTVRVAPLKTGATGAVITLEWSEEQSAGAFMTVPMVAFVLPKGVGGGAITQDFSTESSASGNVFYLLCRGANGEALMLLREESFDAGTQSVQRFAWNGRKFERQGESVTVPLSP